MCVLDTIIQAAFGYWLDSNGRSVVCITTHFRKRSAFAVKPDTVILCNILHLT